MEREFWILVLEWLLEFAKKFSVGTGNLEERTRGFIARCGEGK